MKILVYMGHPAHFHLLNGPIRELKKLGLAVTIAMQKKDILEELLQDAGLPYHNILSEGRKDNRPGLALGMVKRDLRLWRLCRKERPDLMLGTSVELPHVGKLLGIPVINLNEDDCRAVPLYCKLSYPFSTLILAPVSCSTGKWEHKTLHYPGYHELAYLHPRHFTPDPAILSGHFSLERPFFILRFAQLSAHHDRGKTGITAPLAREILARLRARGPVFITSQRPLEPEFEPYRFPLPPQAIHQALYHAHIYIGDSQTMAAEAAVLGTPSLRFNDFAGRLGYLEELENRYGLTYGIPTNQPVRLLQKIDELLDTPHLKAGWQEKRQQMLMEKIDVCAFLTWLIKDFPGSVEIMRKNPSYAEHFK